jgi:hypothetical protein
LFLVSDRPDIFIRLRSAIPCPYETTERVKNAYRYISTCHHAPKQSLYAARFAIPSTAHDHARIRPRHTRHCLGHRLVPETTVSPTWHTRCLIASRCTVSEIPNDVAEVASPHFANHSVLHTPGLKSAIGTVNLLEVTHGNMDNTDLRPHLCPIVGLAVQPCEQT